MKTTIKIAAICVALMAASCQKDETDEIKKEMKAKYSVEKNLPQPPVGKRDKNTTSTYDGD